MQAAQVLAGYSLGEADLLRRAMGKKIKSEMRAQRQRFVASGAYILPGKVVFGGVLTLGSGLPYNYTTGANNSGDGATTDRPVINGVVVGRNVGHGRPIYDCSPFIERPFDIFGEHVHITPRVEAFNVTNHANFVGYSGTWGNGATPGVGFGAPTAGITAQLPARSRCKTVMV